MTGLFLRLLLLLCLSASVALAQNANGDLKRPAAASKGRPAGQMRKTKAEEKKRTESQPVVPEIVVVRQAELTPGPFLERVQEAGGQADFVFTDDRPFKECHASTIVEAGNGALLCAWFGGEEEKADDVAIWLSRFENNVWSMPVKVAKVNETAHWNPVLFRDPARGTYLFFKVGREIPFWETNWTQTKDDGHTWSEPLELVAHDQGGRAPVKNKPIVLSDGTWLAGASTEYKGWKAFADRSQDGGRTGP